MTDRTGNRSEYNIFSYAQKLTNLSGATDFDTSQMTDFYRMFIQCDSMTDYSAVKDWKTSEVTNMSYAFQGKSGGGKIVALDLSWDTSKVTDFSYMFNGQTKMTSMTWANFSTSKAVNMSYFLDYMGNITDINFMKNCKFPYLVKCAHMCSGLKPINNDQREAIKDVVRSWSGFENLSTTQDDVKNAFNQSGINGTYTLADGHQLTIDPALRLVS